MYSLPGVSTSTITPRKILLSDALKASGEEIILDSGNTDSGASPTHRLRPGNVVIKRTSTGRYVEANDANADTGTAPAITSSGHADATADIVLVGNHGTVSVTISTGTGTEAECATDLNADAQFAAHYTASSGGNELTITANRAGADEWFYMDSSTSDTYGFAEGVANESRGADADVRVVTLAGDLQDRDGTAQHAPAMNLMRGHFDESQLINLTGLAKEVLSRRGSVFG